jgi:hypothetical protein
MTKKTQLWLGIILGGGVAYYLYMNYKKTGKFLNATGKARYTPTGWYANTEDGKRVYCPSNEVPCPVDLRVVSR